MDDFETQLAAARSALRTIEDRRVATLTALDGLSQRRRACCLAAVLGNGAAEGERKAIIVDQAAATALLSDLAEAEDQAKANLARIETDIRSHRCETRRAAFEARVKQVLDEHPALRPAKLDAAFINDVEAAYAWMAGLYPTAEVNRSRYLTWWLDEMASHCRRSVSAATFLVAALCRGDIPVEDGGQPWNRFVGLSLHPVAAPQVAAAAPAEPIVVKAMLPSDRHEIVFHG